MTELTPVQDGEALKALDRIWDAIAETWRAPGHEDYHIIRSALRLSGDQSGRIAELEANDRLAMEVIERRKHEIADLKAQLAKAVSVIKPFGISADTWDDDEPCNKELCTQESLGMNGYITEFTLGDLRAASQFIKGLEGIHTVDTPAKAEDKGDGCQLVPKDATEDMKDAYFKLCSGRFTIPSPGEIWTAMLSASPVLETGK